MQLISNRKLNHLITIKRLIRKSKEIIVSVAFLKSSGIDMLRDSLKAKKKVTFFVGTDYYLTEPEAVRTLVKDGHSVFNTSKNKSTFHPKVYYFRNGRQVNVLIGSANMTGGGLDSNFESSLLIKTTTGSKLEKDIRAEFSYFEKHAVDFSNAIAIGLYDSKYQKYHQKHKKADKEFKQEIAKKVIFNLRDVKKFAKKYKSETGIKERFQNRVEQYKIAKRLIAKCLRSNVSTPKDFLFFYDDIARLFYSSGLLRGKKEKAKHYRGILSIFELVKGNHNLSPKELFNKAQPLIAKTKQYGINALTELMNCYNPSKYSVANGRTLRSLAQFNLPSFPAQNNFDANTYERYNDLITAIAVQCNFVDLGHVDHFLSWYYANHVKGKRKKIYR